MLAWGPSKIAKSFWNYFVKGYKFQTKPHSYNRATDNSGICIKGTHFGTEKGFFGVLDEILELQYPESSNKWTVIFNCTWFETSGHGGTHIHPHLKIVEVKKSIKMLTDEKYVLAQQAIQVYNLSYSSYRHDLTYWLVVRKVKARKLVDDNLHESETREHDAF